MIGSNYYEETKYCPRCDEYVRFLQNLAASYCVECGSKVHLFSKKDRTRFLTALQAEKASRRGQKNVS
ncbi:MAG: hypothetical protein DWQ01_11320 [Planctomycetota bacterium]|nr:MAG: hypothetical protein DWQ01_11320 [Planctomycetota bacterium]